MDGSDQSLPTTDTTKITKDRKQSIFAVGVVILIILIGSLVFYRLVINKSQPQLSQQALINQVNYYNIQNKYNQAAKLVKGQKGYNSSSLDQVLLASVYTNQGNYSQALSIYADINKTGIMTESQAESAASVAQQAHDNKLAITYLTQAIKLAKTSKTNPLAGADAANDAQQIQILEKQN